MKSTMKPVQRIVTIFLCSLTLLLLPSCGKQKTEASPDVNRLFTATASIVYDDFEAQATVSRLGDDMWEVEFTSPKTLAGVKLFYNGEDITASYLGLNFSIPESAAPTKSMLTMLFQSFDQAAAGAPLPFTEEDGISVFTGTGDFGKFMLSVDNASGNPVSFEIPEEKLSVQFADYTVIQ